MNLWSVLHFFPSEYQITTCKNVYQFNVQKKLNQEKIFDVSNKILHLNEGKSPIIYSNTKASAIPISQTFNWINW